SLGATYFHLLTGRPPFDLPAPAQLMFAHCTRPAPDPREVVAGLPEGCAAVVRRARGEEPAPRLQSAPAVLAGLGAPLAAGGGGGAAAAAATMAGRAEPVTTAAVASGGTTTARLPSQPPAPRRPRFRVGIAACAAASLLIAGLAGAVWTWGGGRSRGRGDKEA